MPELLTKVIRQPVPLPREIAIDWGLIDPDDVSESETTPEDKALAILAPHLAVERLYQL